MPQKKIPGKLKRTDIQFIEDNVDVMSVAEIADELRRNVPTIQKHIDRMPKRTKTQKLNSWVEQLHISVFWESVKCGLMDSEVPYFENMWASYMDQFGVGHEVLPTDELMVKDLIMMDIMAQRAMNDKKKLLMRISALEDNIRTETSKSFEVQDSVSVSSWRTELSALITIKNNISKEHTDYQTKKDVKLKDLKGSREQRFKQVEDRRKNIFELIKDLDTKESRNKEGRLSQKVKMASDLVFYDWNQVTEYEDGNVDKPFLSPEGELHDARLSNEQDKTDKSSTQ